jgi:hypothetical protein
MTPQDAIGFHHRLCDELHQLAMEENRFLRQHQRSPEASLLEKKRLLLGQLDESLAGLREIPAASTRDPELLQQVEKTRGRILQILQLDRENEQLLLRYSLTAGRPTNPTAAPTVASSSALLQKIYARCS